MSRKESMESKIYDLMDWAEIEAVVYAEENQPRKILGPHVVDDGILIQAFFPDAAHVAVKLADGQTVDMVEEDEAGFFAVLLDGNKVPEYSYLVKDAEGAEKEAKDPYVFENQITEKEQTRFASGIWTDAPDKMGSHPMNLNGTDGVYFAVWAPDAVRVSVVGDFNGWDGRVCPMNRLDSGIYELFLPDVAVGSFYKYEIKSRAGMVYLKADPFAFTAQQLPEAASVVTRLDYDFHDADWIRDRELLATDNAPMAIYEVNVGDWKRNSDGTYMNYKEMAPELAAYVKDMGYTYVELMPVMEYPDDETIGYATSGFFAPTSRYGSPQDFMEMIDVLHQAGIGVILDWVPSCFARGNDGLSAFDGTCLYEHLDQRKGVHPASNQLIFNYGRGEVASFLKASALFWLKTYHADGLRINDLATMVYLDYGRKNGQWVANMYGGNENLEAIDFIRSLNLEIRKQVPGVLMIAEEETGFPQVTGSAEGDGLGFNYKWNNGCINDYMQYIQLDPLFRGSHQDDLTFSSVYMYSERFLLALSHANLIEGGKTLLKQMPGGKKELKAANLRLTYGYLMAHPGKKLLLMGQDFGQMAKLTPDHGVAWNELETEEGQKMQAYVKALIRLYKDQPALYELDENPEGFEWISNLDWKRNMLVFLRKSMKTEETLLIVANFSNVEYDDFLVGVPYPGKYKEIFNSDDVKFGGSGIVNPRVKLSRAVEQDERRDSIKVKVAPLSVSIYRFTEAVARNPLADKLEIVKKAAKKTGTAKAAPKKPVKKAAPKKAAAKTTAGETVGKAAEAVKKAVTTTVTETVPDAAEAVKKAVAETVPDAAEAVKKAVTETVPAKAAEVKEAAKKAVTKKAPAEKKAPARKKPAAGKKASK